MTDLPSKDSRRDSLVVHYLDDRFADRIQTAIQASALYREYTSFRTSFADTEWAREPGIDQGV